MSQLAFNASLRSRVCALCMERVNIIPGKFQWQVCICCASWSSRVNRRPPSVHLGRRSRHDVIYLTRNTHILNNYLLSARLSHFSCVLFSVKGRWFQIHPSPSDSGQAITHRLMLTNITDPGGRASPPLRRVCVFMLINQGWCIALFASDPSCCGRCLTADPDGCDMAWLWSWFDRSFLLRAMHGYN